MPLDVASLARELFAAQDARSPVPSPPTARDPHFDLSAAYAVEAEIVRLGRARGRRPVGRKVGFANRALWRVLKIDTLVWATMYDDSVHHAPGGHATLALGDRLSPRIEPEVVVKLKAPLTSRTEDPAVALGAVEWLALGFEILDCPFPDWKFQPPDFVAAFGLHAGLVVGTPVGVTPALIPAFVDGLATFTLRLSKNGELIERGSGKNVLRSPALCLGELAGAAARQAGSSPLAAGEIISTGTLTTPQPIAREDVWRAEVDGLALAPLTLALQ
jgi:2-oxo-3-hexenedioate decarboxylase